LQSLDFEVESHQHHHNLELHFFDAYKVPLFEMTETVQDGQRYAVLDTARFKACNAEFMVKVDEGAGTTVIEASCESPLPSNFHLRVQEALQYITGKSAVYRAKIAFTLGSQTLELVSPSRVSAHQHFRPPIQPAAWEYRTYGWKLFSAYLAYLIDKTENTYWNPLAYHLYNAREASANSIDAWAIGISVALEAAPSLVAFKNDSKNTERITKFQTLMREHIATLSGYDREAKRMEGLIQILSKKRPQDVLHQLAQEGQLHQEYIKDWGDLRNRHVHPDIKNIAKPSLKQQKKMLSRIHRVHVLLTQLTFYLIGYEGVYTDYGAEGFPSKIYPVPRNSSENKAL